MKKLIFLLLLSTSCYYDDICPRDAQIRALNKDLAREYATMKAIELQPWSVDVAEQMAEQGDVIESLEMEKFILEQSPCNP